MDLPNLYTTSGLHTSSESSTEGGREGDFDNFDILRPSGTEIQVPDSNLRDFVKTPKLLTREGRQQLHGLRRNLGGPYGHRRVERLEENPETPSQSLTTQARSNTPNQPEKKGPLSKLFGYISLPENQFKFSTPKNNKVAEQEQTDFSISNPQRTNIASSEIYT